MSSHSEDLLSVAKTLIDYGKGDTLEIAYFRSAANRCYYSVYSKIRRRIEQANPNAFSKSGQHKRLTEALTNSMDAHISAIGARLNNLKSLREDCDYILQGPCDEAVITTAHNTAERAIDKFNKLSHSQIVSIVNAF